MEENVIRPNKGLHQDNSPQDQPKDTYRFALNSVSETELGDFAFLGNEEGNEVCDSLPPNFIPLGKVYIGEGQTVIFSVSRDETISEIGILNDGCIYETHVNDEESDEGDKLNFKVTHQIQATYRLRRGCERTIYFTDDFNKPRYYNFDSPEDFQNDNGTWAGKEFSLFKGYSKIPEFRSVEVINSGGVLAPGSYNISVRYLDEGLNPSEWIITSPIINVYNDLTNEDFLNIRGSINSDTDYINFPNTSKSIKVELDNIDDSYPFYQLAFIEATNGSGFVSGVKHSEIIPTSKDFFIYTGVNVITQGTEEEILFSNDIIHRANNIEQIENRLILANTQGKNVDYCKLQKYASRIKADVVTKKVITNDINDPRNTKNPTSHFGDMLTGGVGYMPGEIYSFGIVYVFSDGTLSPVFHIPGKSPNVTETMVFSPGPDTYPMSINNQSENNIYIDNDNCSNNDYWSLDSEGDPLVGMPVRHHRFPLRSQLNLPLVTEEDNSAQIFNYYKLELTASGTIDLPCTQEMIDDGECSVLVTAPPFQARVSYTVDGVPAELVMNIDTNSLSNPITEVELSNLYSSNDIVVTMIEESDGAGGFYTVTTMPSDKGLTYTTQIVPVDFESESRLFSTEIFGIKFSGVDIPSLVDTNGDQVIGYYIVRNERVENEKTILDSAVLTPSVINNKYISHGLLQPEIAENKLSKDVFGLIHPEHKFNGREYNNYTKIVQEGNFNIVRRNYSKTRYNDVLDGTSYDSDIHKEGNDDGRKLDGWSLGVITRDSYTNFVPRNSFEIDQADIKERFYLSAVHSRDINDGANTVYNIAGDNKVGMIQLEEDDIINPIANNLPYVLLMRDVSDSYSNFRVLPYYKDSINMETTSTATIFSGDTYVAPMRYTNSIFWDNRLAKRAGKTSVWNYIIGAILIIVGVILLIFGGSGALVIGAGVGIIGGGALFISSGIERDALIKAYYEEYDKGLRETALDNFTKLFYKDNTSPFGVSGHSDTSDGPSDDEIQWIGDCVTDLWFESQINISLRNKMVSDAPTFLDAPGIAENGNTAKLKGWEYFGLDYEKSVTRLPISKLDNHMNKKLLTYNSDRDDNKEYIGHSLGEWYQVNPDFHRKNAQKIYYHLPLEYDCCSDCKEDFPHRVHYSEQSFQEELTDNYRVFLPNNYKDLEGETGEITNVFKIGNNLFIHTREGLWQMPRSYQERITDQIVSFIGTGSFFEIPPQKVIDDDNGSSAGLQHTWSALKTPYGYLFVCENQRKVYLFNGKDLKTLSNIGMSNYFKENTKLKINDQYYSITGKNYIYDDNPSNPFGSGYISTYDTKKERLIITKKDFLLSEEVVGNNDFELCSSNGQLTIFPDISQTIADEEVDGWNFVGIQNCQLVFERTTVSTRIEEREITTITVVPNDSDIIIWLDTSGSFDEDARQSIKDAIDAWLIAFESVNPSWVGNLYYVEEPGESDTERWMNSLASVKASIYGGDVTGRNIIMVNFVNEASTDYHNISFNSTIDNPTSQFLDDYADFLVVHNEIVSTGGTFRALSYPVVFDMLFQDTITSEFLKTVLAAVRGISYTDNEVAALEINPVVPNWNTMKTALKGNNPYPDDGVEGLSKYGWQVISNSFWNGSGDVITAQAFQEDMDQFLTSSQIIEVETIEVEVTYTETEYKTVDGVIVEDPVDINSSWTMSFSLKQDTWTSWHSYLPSFYINTPEKFYSWKYENDNIWKHNSENLYQTYYGEYNPHILEYISLSNPLVTRIWNHIRLNTEAKIFDTDTQQYYEDRFTTFNKAVIYNTRQCSGLLLLLVKDTQPNPEDYFSQQIVNRNDNSIIIDRTEKDWFINDFRDIRIDYNKPIWNSNISSLQSEYFIDKILNDTTLDVEKDWTELESFKDKYLVVRLIFDNFANVKLITNYSVENEQQSFI